MECAKPHGGPGLTRPDQAGQTGQPGWLVYAKDSRASWLAGWLAAWLTAPNSRTANCELKVAH